MTVKELKKMRIKTKDVTERNTLLMIIDYAQKLAKEKNDLNVDKYLPQAIKKYKKVLNETVNPNPVEVKIVNEIGEMILPKMLNEEETKQVIAEILQNCNEISKKCFGKVMGQLKQRQDIDMKLASKILKEIL